MKTLALKAAAEVNKKWGTGGCGRWHGGAQRDKTMIKELKKRNK